jgi:hypothetical protein
LKREVCAALLTSEDLKLSIDLRLVRRENRLELDQAEQNNCGDVAIGKAAGNFAYMCQLLTGAHEPALQRDETQDSQAKCGREREEAHQEQPRRRIRANT